MRGCNCHSGLGALPVTVTASCPQNITDVSDPSNPHVVAVSWLAHDLCLARYYVEKGGAALEGFASELLVDLESELKALWGAIKNGATNVWGWVKDLGGRVKDFIQWLDDQASHALDWIMFAGAMFLLYAFSPAINDATHAITHRRKKR